MPPPVKIRKTGEQRTLSLINGIIRFEVDKILALKSPKEDDYGRYSPEIVVGGVPWRANVYRGSFLAVFLHCMNNQLTPWSIDVDAEYILVNSNSRKTVTSKKRSSFNNEVEEEDCWGQGLLRWEKVVDVEEGFIKDDKITIEIRFWISNIKGIKPLPFTDFTDPNDPRHDVTLVIEGEKIYVSKQILAAYSLFFNSVFYGQFSESNKDEIELKDVNRKEFIEMLKVIYPSCKKIAEDSAEYLLKLADRFQIVGLIDRVEKYFLDSDLSVVNKLIIADKYRLVALQDHCLAHLTTAQDFKNIEESPIFKDLSDAIVRRLFIELAKIAK